MQVSVAHQVVVAVTAEKGSAGVSRGVGAALTQQVSICLGEQCGGKHAWGGGQEVTTG